MKKSARIPCSFFRRVSACRFPLGTVSVSLVILSQGRRLCAEKVSLEILPATFPVAKKILRLSRKEGRLGFFDALTLLP